MLAELKELWRFRELLWAMVERELKIRYKNSALGFLWSLVNPLATVLVITLVFKFFLRNETPNFSASVLAVYLRGSHSPGQLRQQPSRHVWNARRSRRRANQCSMRSGRIRALPSYRQRRK